MIILKCFWWGILSIYKGIAAVVNAILEDEVLGWVAKCVLVVVTIIFPLAQASSHQNWHYLLLWIIPIMLIGYFNRNKFY